MHILISVGLILTASFQSSVSLDCYQCTGINNITDCHNLAVCAYDEFCYTDTSGIGPQTRFTLGCRPKQTCFATTTTDNPLSIIGRDVNQNLECSQCCAVDACNKMLCTTGTHAATAVCEDDPNFNCAQTSAVFNICNDIHHAKLVCRKFCGLCNTVDGNWATWSSWSSCDVTCASGTRTRTRNCTNPAPQDGGLPCSGSNTDITTCSLQACPVHGGWTLWSSWGSCSVSCGVGLQRRDRQCSNPYPGIGGEQCHGDTRDDRSCFVRPCADGVWSAWSSWGSCSATCLGGLSKRTRTCNNPTPSDFGHDCVGNDEESQLCNTIPCQGMMVNGGWSYWTTWSTCPVTCGGALRTRTRTCDNPAPANFGLACIGNSEENSMCGTAQCYAQSQYGNVRLVNGSSMYEGRLEVYHDGSWGTVCDDSFTNAAASVVCKMLGFPWSGAQQYQSAHFGSGSLPILLDDVICNGAETSLFDCSHRGWNTSDCTHGEDVGVSCLGTGSQVNGGWTTWASWSSCPVTCGGALKTRTRTCTSPAPANFGLACIGNSEDKDVCGTVACYSPYQYGNVRLVNGPNMYEGRLEVYHDGAWGTVCDDGFTLKAAKVVCKMLGFPWSGAKQYQSAHYGQGSLPILLDDVVCYGTESSLFECSHNSWGTNNCGHGEDVGVSCQGQVRLVSGPNNIEGRVEIYHNGGWGTVCDDSFNTASAQVICKMMNLPWTGAVAYSSAHYGAGTLPIMLDDILCSGSEDSVYDCTHRPWGENNCGHGEDAGVACAALYSGLYIRLVGNTGNSGRVEVSQDGTTWGTVCDDSFSTNGAKVVCRMLDYSTNHATFQTSTSPGSGSIFLDDVSCTGTESSLMQCSHSTWGTNNCGHGEDVEVTCT